MNDDLAAMAAMPRRPMNDYARLRRACFKVSLFHAATILVVVVSPCPTCKRRIVLIAVFET
jgi:hypothetical protein